MPVLFGVAQRIECPNRPRLGVAELYALPLLAASDRTFQLDRLLSVLVEDRLIFLGHEDRLQQHLKRVLNAQ